MDGDPRDHQVRLRAFAFLEEQTALRGDVLPWKVLHRGFEFEGQRVPLVSQQGIFKPRILAEIPLTIRTAPVVEGRVRPYDDGLDEAGLLGYRYRGTDPAHRENVGLRLAMHRQVPLIYLFGVVKGEYLPVWPVFVHEDDPKALCFKVAVDDRKLAHLDAPEEAKVVAEARRGYVTRLTLQRVHQASFRQRVLRAYREKCAVCRLRRVELLEAAHILPDSHPQGKPVVPNGIALCKLHHAAFDRHIMGIRPDLIVEIRRDVLEDTDGPMLKFGLQEIAGQHLVVPRARSQQPGKEYLEERYEMFRRVG